MVQTKSLDYILTNSPNEGFTENMKLKKLVLISINTSQSQMKTYGITQRLHKQWVVGEGGLFLMKSHHQDLSLKISV